MNFARVLLSKKKKQPLQHRQLSGHFISSSARIGIKASVWRLTREFGAQHVFGVQLICGLVLVLDAEPVLGARVFGTELVLGIRVWREGCFWSRVAVLGKRSSLVRGTLVIS